MDTVFIDVKTTNLTFAELLAEVLKLQQAHPELDIFLDGDLYAVIGRPKETA